MDFWKRHGYVVFYLAALVVILIYSVRVLGRVGAGEALPAMAVGTAPHTIVIDPGHGGADGGAVGVSGTREAGLNLAVSRKLRDILLLCGQPVVMTRDSDAALEDPAADTLSAKKITDTKNRLALIQATPGAVVVSIHQNMFPESRYAGAQVFWAAAEGSQALAETAQETLRGALDPENHRMAKAADSGIYLMRNLTCPGILVECGFLSNPAEEELLRQDAYQTRIAAAVASALLCWQQAQSAVES